MVRIHLAQYGALAQSVEHLTFNQVVRGSNPRCFILNGIMRKHGAFLFLKTVDAPTSFYHNNHRNNSKECGHIVKRLFKHKCLGLLLGMMLLISSILSGCIMPMEDDSQSSISNNSYESVQEENQIEEHEELDAQDGINEDGTYTSKEEVAAYLHQYQRLPDNFITKKEAKELGWVSNEGNLGEGAPGKSIGGDRFGNREGILPTAEGRKYYECDINTDGGYRGAERIVYSNDGLIYYTEDHYESFELLYGE